MPDYPNSPEMAQNVAGSVAQNFRNYECVECGRAVLRAIGPRPDSWVIKLRNVEGDGLVVLPSAEIQAGTTGHHVGIRIGNIVFDNHFHSGLPLEDWRHRYKDIDDRDLELYERPATDFFGAIFRSKEYSKYASNRPQEDDFLA